MTITFTPSTTPTLIFSVAGAAGTDPFGNSYPAGIQFLGSSSVPALIETDTWHTITLDANWTAGSPAPQYRLLPDGNLQLAGKATHASFSTETALNSSNPIPSAYRPVSDKKIYQGNRAGGFSGAAIDTTGIVYGEPNGTSSTVCDLTGVVDLL